MWELDCEESWALKNWCFWTVVLKTLESPLDCKEIQPVHSKGDGSWVFFARNGAKAETPVLWPPHAKSWLIGRLWCWEGLGAGGEGDNRVWGGWMASPTRCTWVWVNSGSWWWTGRPGVLQFMGSQRVGHDWATELKWTDIHGSLNIPGLLKTQFIIVGWLEHILILNGLKMPFYVILGNFLVDRCWKVAPGRVEHNGGSQTLQSDVASGGWTLNQAFQSTLGSSGD